MKPLLRILASMGVMGALLCAALPAAAGEVYYRWLDDRGHPVHSDRPPPKGVDYEVISTGSSLKREVEADEGAVPLAVEPTVSNDFERVDDEPEEVKKNPEYCATARANLNELDTRARIRARDENGDTYFLNDEQKEQERQKALEAIEAYCE